MATGFFQGPPPAASASATEGGTTGKIIDCRTLAWLTIIFSTYLHLLLNAKRQWTYISGEYSKLALTITAWTLSQQLVYWQGKR